ncbi:MAG: DUF1254 domain-containing protein [Chromatiales bacterium]|jgi:hypothetical protein
MGLQFLWFPEIKIASFEMIRASLLTFLLVSITPSWAMEQSIDDRMTHHRAVEAVVWAMPLMNFKKFRDALADAGVGPNDIGYFSEVQDWKFQTATPNNTTPYINFYWNLDDGPIVVEIPASIPGVGVFGTIMDAWQSPIDDVGAAGRDKGRGGKYLIVPEGYEGPLLPNAYVYTQETNNGFAILRPIIESSSAENLALAVEFTKQIKVYPLSKAGQPAETKYIDLAGKLLEMTPVLDGSIYSEIHELLQEEPIQERNKSMMGMLTHLGIEVGKPFEPSKELQAVFDKAGPDALEYMISAYHRSFNPPYYDGKKWSTIVPSGVIETEFTFVYPTHFDYIRRGATYYGVISSVKNYGTASFYLDLAEDPSNDWLYGDRQYKLTVPANVPVRDFWSITTYDLKTAAFVRNMPRNTIDSTMDGVEYNADGSIDIYFGPKPPKGKESNWLKTDPDQRFFLLGRFYGPEPALFDKSFQMNDIERLK